MSGHAVLSFHDIHTATAQVEQTATGRAWLKTASGDCEACYFGTFTEIAELIEKQREALEAAVCEANRQSESLPFGAGRVTLDAPLNVEGFDGGNAPDVEPDKARCERCNSPLDSEAFCNGDNNPVCRNRAPW